MTQDTKLTFKILSRHIIIGALVTVFIFWIINEIPNRDYLLARLHIWLTIPIGLTLTTWLTSKLVYYQLTIQNKNKFLVAFGFIFFSWTIAFLSTAIIEGVFETIRNKRFEILDALEGYAIYRLWVYWGIAIIHGLTGGIFLAIDLKNNLKVDRRQTTKSKLVLTNWEDYWKIFDQLLDLLDANNRTDIISEFKDAQKYVNGLTDGWYDFKFAFEKTLKANRHNLTEEQIYIADFLLDEVNKSLTNR
jgi:hypothetical protein